MDEQYQPQHIEPLIQQYWQKHKSFEVKEDLSKEKFYCLAMFPYPSGHLHVGHVRNYTIGDVIARYQRMRGKNVLQPMGWDAFGLPAENAAIKNNVPPAKWTYENINAMREQLKRLGFAYDWRREIATCDPNYYRWEQWLFVKLFKKGLVYRKNAVVNWDPVDQTVLANEQVVNGRGWRSGAQVERREIPQWFLKITDYADELRNDLSKLVNWPEQVIAMQRNWIGRSEGVQCHFLIEGHKKPLEIFTTRPDTLFGVTYLAISPQHPLAKKISNHNPAIANFLTECNNIKVAEAELATLEKKGVDTGLTALHPITKQAIPIWVANFVLVEYGSGAIMAVPAHDQRDFEFAKKYNLPIQQVIKPADNSSCDVEKMAFTAPGILMNSEKFNDLPSREAGEEITLYLKQHKSGRHKVNFRLRDWGISRQRYWGTPIPMIYCNNCGDVAVPEKDLPVKLPENVEFSGATSPLKNMPEFFQTVCPECGQQANRETDTFDTFMESSWYYARFACFDQKKSMLDDRATYWTPVDHYIGGIEHAVMHLLYARFIHKVIRDEGLLNSDEPFLHLLTQGMVLKDGAKMSKSKGNTVNPQELIDKYGADTLRLFIMFAAPPEQSLEWSDSGVEGAHRFLKRLWAFCFKYQSMIKAANEARQSGGDITINWNKLSDPTLQNEPQIKAIKVIHKEIYAILKKVHHDMDNQQFNTIVSSSMKILNLLPSINAATNASPVHFSKRIDSLKERLMTDGLSILLRILAPIAPHISQYLWQDLAYGENIMFEEWPKIVKSSLKSLETELVVQINGKLRGHILVSTDANQQTIETTALEDPTIKRHLVNKLCKKIIIVPGKLVNIVVTESS